MIWVGMDKAAEDEISKDASESSVEDDSIESCSRVAVLMMLVMLTIFTTRDTLSASTRANRKFLDSPSPSFSSIELVINMADT